MNRSKDKKNNYFGTLPKVQINAQFKNGQLIDLETEQPIELKEGANLKIFTNTFNVKDHDYERYNKVISEKILDKGSLIYMKVPLIGVDYAIVKIELVSDLFMVKKNNKSSILKSSQFIAHEMDYRDGGKEEDFEPIKERTLNQIFFRISMKYRPEARVHTANIYECSYDKDWNKLELYRF